MFVSPCTLRSTQCAALIALATVAGIARVETNPQPNHAASTPEATPRTVFATRAELTRFVVAPTWSAPWLQPFARLTLWLLAADDRPHPDLITNQASDPDQNPVATLRTQLALPTRLAESLGESAVPPSQPRIARGSRSHLIPFAVGPPRSPLTLKLRANGTPVPTVDFARWFCAISVVHFSFHSVARIACLSFSRHPSVGAVFFPSFALRGATGTCSESIRSRPSLCADAPHGVGLFLL